MDAPTPRKKNIIGCLLLGILPCLLMLALRQTGVTRKFEVEVLGLDWNFEEIVEYIGADYPEGAVEIEHESSHFDRGFFIEVRFKAPPDDAMKFAESICDGVLYQGYDPFDTIDGGQPSPNAHLIFGFGYAYYSYSPNASQSLFGYRCQLHTTYGRWEQIRVDTSNPKLYEVRYEIPTEQSTRQYAPNLFFDAAHPVWEVEYLNPTSNLPFMIVGLMLRDGQYVLVGETICFETRKNFDHDSQNGFPYSIYPRELIGKNVVISVDNQVVVDTTISRRMTLSHPNQQNSENDLLLNYCVFQKAWESGTHTITLHVDMPDFQDETWTFEVK